MRHRFSAAAFAFVFAAITSSFAACSDTLGPGDDCEGGWFQSGHCPAGYYCDDFRTPWKCELEIDHGGGSSSSYDPPPTPPVDAGSPWLDQDAALVDASADGAAEADATASD